MASYWDRTDRQRACAAERKQSLRELQLAQWGWCDMRQRDGTGRLIPPRKQLHFPVRKTRTGTGPYFPDQPRSVKPNGDGATCASVTGREGGPRHASAAGPTPAPATRERLERMHDRTAIKAKPEPDDGIDGELA